MQALITGALQAVLPPDSTFTAVTMTQQLNSDTVIVDAQFQLREAQLAVLVANKCCDLEVLFLQQAVLRIDPTAIGEGCSSLLSTLSPCCTVRITTEKVDNLVVVTFHCLL